jgi:hypothetical protein
MRPLKVRLALYCFLGLLVWGVISRLSAPSYDEVTHQRQTEAVLKAGKAYREQLKRDREEIARLRRVASKHVREADSLKAERDTIYLPEVTPAACAPYSLKLSLCESETRSLRSALAADSAALDTAAVALNKAEVRADTLERLLRSRPKPCRILGVACPKVGVGPTIGTDLKPDVRIGVFFPLF